MHKQKMLFSTHSWCRSNRSSRRDSIMKKNMSLVINWRHINPWSRFVDGKSQLGKNATNVRRVLFHSTAGLLGPPSISCLRSHAWLSGGLADAAAAATAAAAHNKHNWCSVKTAACAAMYIKVAQGRAIWMPGKCQVWSRQGSQPT